MTTPVPQPPREQLDKANELKLEGNELFKARKWNEALVSYRTALSHLPPRNRSDKPDLDQADVDSQGLTEDPNMAAVSDIPDALDAECEKARSVLYANIGACLSKMEDHKGVVDACSQALSDDPRYVKALQRRAASNEKIGTWSSLTSAQEDYNLLLELLPPGSAESTQTRKALQSLEPRTRVAREEETAEMMDKLKGLGNTILGQFGLSTDNFKFEPNGQGGYSMNFAR
ncbi:TPR-like protein [Boletus edulis BED1]|uniref:TPR-like protein n=1 Tax=Boletus edulis BED1 TaxID=1328754 RepID=A0AAD4GII9_BOLED|nr:TPR-like protein [Boletus edulis BED1]